AGALRALVAAKDLQEDGPTMLRSLEVILEQHEKNAGLSRAKVEEKAVVLLKEIDNLLTATIISISEDWYVMDDAERVGAQFTSPRVITHRVGTQVVSQRISQDRRQAIRAKIAQTQDSLETARLMIGAAAKNASLAQTTLNQVVKDGVSAGNGADVGDRI